MANPKGNISNLRPNSSLSAEERSNRAKRAGIASGVARRDKRSSKERLTMLLQLAMKDKDGNGVRSPITGKLMSVGEAIDTALIKKAISGDVRAANILYDLLNVKTIKTEVTGANGEPLIPISKMTDEEIRAELERIENSINK